MSVDEWRVAAGGTLGAALGARFPECKSATRRAWLRDGRVRVNGVAVNRANHPLSPGDRLVVAARAATATGASGAFGTAGTLPILYADADLVVVDKPAGLLSVADARENERTVPRLLKALLRAHGDRLPGERPDDDGQSARRYASGRRHRPGIWPAHRLDRETSGVLVLARSPEAKRRLAAAWDKVEKLYWAVTDGAPNPAEGEVDAPLREGAGLFVRISRAADARPARTLYRTLSRRGARALVEVRPLTGRKHQIRVHLASLGAPVAGDDRYGVAADAGAGGSGGAAARRLLLHAARLVLTQPFTGERLFFTSPYPSDFPAEFRSGLIPAQEAT